jgi:hypothetical protein
VRPSVLNTDLASSDWIGAEYKSAHETAAKEAIYRRLHAAVAVHGIQVRSNMGAGSSCSAPRTDSPDWSTTRQLRLMTRRPIVCRASTRRVTAACVDAV